LLLIFDLDDTLFKRLPDHYSEEQLRNIQAFEGVYELLNRKDIIKVLVTKGDSSQQQKKIHHLKISSWFDRIMFCSTDLEKKECFLQAHHQFPHQKVYVIGDRIDSEIRWGKELGFSTIHLRQGKYKDLLPRDQWEIPDYEITSFKELATILKLP